ncbi:hypothetical protein IGI42_002050 [Enterococcus sp. AZ109]
MQKMQIFVLVEGLPKLFLVDQTTIEKVIYKHGLRKMVNIARFLIYICCPISFMMGSS